MINIAIVDDEKGMIDQIEENLRNYEAFHAEEFRDEHFQIYTFQNGLEFLSSNRGFDIVFLDIEMPLMDGLSAAKKLRKGDDRCVIIFITNMAQYATKGYEVEAMDFLIKPLNPNTFGLKVKKALEIARKNRERSLFIFDNGRKIRLQIHKIVYVEVYGHKIYWHTLTGEYESWDSLRSVKGVLGNGLFSMCNNSQLVNLDYVSEIKGSQVFLEYGENSVTLQITRTKRKSFLDDFTLAFGTGVRRDR